MVSIHRIREMSLGTHNGSWVNTFDGSHGTVTLDKGIKRCEDAVEAPYVPVDHGLLIETKAITRVGTVSGVGAFGVNIWTDYPHGSQSIPFAHIALGDVPPSDIEAATEAAARANPGRPDVSLPVFIAELKDIPGMLQRKGHRKGQKPRNSVAENNFGWDSLFRDVGSMFNFTEQVNDRMKELKALHSKGGLKRKRTVWQSGSSETSAPLVIWSLEGTFVEAQIRSERTSKKWVSTRWRPAVTGHPPNADEMLQQARLAVHGWRLSPADAWNLLPWSWFADYFFNVGDFLEATSNRTEFTLESICVMQHDTTRHSFDILSVTGGHIDVQAGRSEYDTKVRNIGSLGLTATQPFLSAKQVTTLAGIIANR